jgi:D-sedoheptulose 7-phosphate isomerase
VLATRGSKGMRKTDGDRPFDGRRIAERYIAGFHRLLDEVDLAALDRVAQCLRDARDAGATVYVAGNGGSAATASHWTSDLGNATKRSGRGRMRVMCLSDNTPWLTALANDEGYERVFSGQLENFAAPGDVLAVISASGNSRNLLRAVELAQERDLCTVGLVGFDGGVLKDRLDHAVWVRTEGGAYGPVESVHAVLCDILTTCLIEDLLPVTQQSIAHVP